jgi:DNA-3-methyladenine glycosylase I
MFCPHCGNKVLPDHRFCASCGAKQDFTFLDIGKDQSKKLQLRPIDFKDLFEKMESTLRKQSSLSKEDFDKEFGRFKNINYKNDTNEELYWKMVQVIFYSGMTAAIVTAKLPAIRKYFADYKSVKEYKEGKVRLIMDDKGVISNERKIKACITNANKFDDIVKRFGSFAAYVESFGDLDKETVLDTLKRDLMKFGFLGVRTAYHFMLDMGLNVWKPDRVICRILYRLGLIDNEGDIEETVKVGREISIKVSLPIRYLDIVFVKYGQQGAEEPFGLDNGICLSNKPRCHLCGIKEYCIRNNNP